jgi:hypothetical protein
MLRLQRSDIRFAGNLATGLFAVAFLHLEVQAYKSPSATR